MIFNAELIRFKSMSSGALRLEIDIPQSDSTSILKHIVNFLDKPLTVDMNVEVEGYKQDILMITNKQIEKIQATYTDIAKKHGIDRKETVTRLKLKLLGKEDISIKDISKEQASEYIERLEAILNNIM